MNFKSLLIQIKKIPISLKEFNQYNLDSEVNIHNNLLFLKSKKNYISSITKLLLCNEDYIDSNAFKKIFDELDYISYYIEKLIKFTNDSEEEYSDIGVVNIYEMLLYMYDNNKYFDEMFISNMNVDEIVIEKNKRNEIKLDDDSGLDFEIIEESEELESKAILQERYKALKERLSDKSNYIIKESEALKKIKQINDSPNFKDNQSLALELKIWNIVLSEIKSGKTVYDDETQKQDQDELNKISVEIGIESNFNALTDLKSDNEEKIYRLG